MICTICGRMQPRLKVGNWLKADWVLPETAPDDPCTPASFWTRCVWPKQDQATQTGFAWTGFFLWKNGRLDLASMTQPDSGCTLAITKLLLNQIWHVYWVSMIQQEGWNPAATKVPPMQIIIFRRIGTQPQRSHWHKLLSSTLHSIHTDLQGQTLHTLSRPDKNISMPEYIGSQGPGESTAAAWGWMLFHNYIASGKKLFL